MSEPGAAWPAVRENTPVGRHVDGPGYEERYDQWSMFAIDPSEMPIVGKP